MEPITRTAEWEALVAHGANVVDLRAVFESDPGRVERLTLAAGDLVADLSKHLVTEETIGLLAAVARRSGLAERIEAMFSGEGST